MALKSLLLVCATTFTLACGGSASTDDVPRASTSGEADDGSASEGSPSDDEPEDSAATGAESPGLAIEERQVGGVWLFWHDSQDHNDALLTGPARIVDGCLEVGGYVVIWHESWAADVAAAVRQLAVGASQDFSVGGGEWGTRIPSSIEARCGAAAVWSGSPVGE